MPIFSQQILKKWLLACSLLLSLFCGTTVRAQADDTIVSTVTGCMQLPDYFYCNNANIGTKSGEELYEGFGYCCPPNSQSQECQNDSNGNECTNGPDEVQGIALYKTFWSGMTLDVCNSTSYELTASPDKNFHYADKIVI